ncbi:hypothetical protein K2173_001656 [Erythroxylum novogranatense]|uniref:Protein E6 n=1 Tax=Erythroxylum novogranatense TaxID=1862640 RepID=A0AAV8T578_9ROSI|nr:hypothetical protein K2173_001656 [Erythroxylum novogranatense]
MAFSAKFLSLLLLLAVLSPNAYARESRFFSKVSASTAPTVTDNNSNNNVKETTVATKKEDEQPSFVPETQSYGLYSQESLTVIPTTATTKLGNAPYKTSTYVPYTTETGNTNINNNNYYHESNQYNNNAFEERQNSNFGETSLQQNRYYTSTNPDNTYHTPNPDNSYNNNNYHYRSSNAYGNTEKQGMSDTRFLENGKYFYDLVNENNYDKGQYYTNPNQNQNQNQVYNYDTKGYYNSNYGNSEYNPNNNVKSYQNQENFQEFANDRYVP